MKSKLWRVGDEELGYIRDALQGGLSGEFNRRLETNFAQKFESQYAIGVNSGTSALHTALFAVGVQPGDEVIVPPLTFSAPAIAVVQAGAVPVFADVDPDTFTIDPGDVAKKISPRTKAIIPVALYGLSADMDPIMELARAHGLHVIEDTAECCLGRYKGRLAGTIGNMAIFSFERSKHMTSGGGGMIITDNEALATRARKFSILGYSAVTANQLSYKLSKDDVQRPDFARHEFIGYNYRLPEICAAAGLAQLEKLDGLVRQRREIAALFTRAVDNCDWLAPQKIPDDYVSACWTYVMKIEGDARGISWMDFRRTFIEEGGDAFYAAWMLTYLEPAFQDLTIQGKRVVYEEGLCPVAEDTQKKLVQLKTNYETLDEAEAQAEALAKTIKRLEGNPAQHKHYATERRQG